MTRYIVGGVVLLALFAGSYFLGCRDGSNNQDPIVSSLIDGIKGYNRQNQQFAKELAVIEKEKAAAIAIGEKEGRRADSIAKTRTPLPREVPTACTGWADNLWKCDQENTALRSSLGATRDALNASARIKLLAQRKSVRDSARADSAVNALKRERGKDEILGIKLPSRSTSFLAGTATGSVVTLILVLIATQAGK
jgi:hypothetical protein